MEASAQDTESRSLFLTLLRSDAIVIAAATLIAYSFVFSYEAGFCYYYAIPLNLISLNLSTALAAGGALLLAFYTFFVFRFPFGRIWILQTDDECRLWADRLIYAAVFSITFLSQGMNAIAVIAMVAVLPLLIDRAVKGIKQLQVTLEQHPITVYFLGRRLPARAYLFVSVLAVLLVASFASGRGRASYEPRYVTRADGRDYVVLRIYGDNVVAAPYALLKDHSVQMLWTANKETVIVTRGLRIFRLGGANQPSDFHDRSYPILTAANARKHGFWGWVFAYNDTF